MQEGYTDEAAEFNSEEVEQFIRKAIHVALGNDAQYNPKKVNEWTNGIVTNVLKDLQALNRPFKYVITCIITKMIGAGFVSTTSQFWDASKDGF
jgi:dynein light chain Tctex-type 1